MGLSRITFLGDGTQDIFNVVFALGQISRSDVTAYVEGEVDGLGHPILRPITFLTDTSIQLGGDIASTAGKIITFDRTTERENLIVNYEDGDILNEENLNTSQKQMIMLLHEALDGRFSTATEINDMGGFRVVNLGYPIDSSDAATKSYVDDRIEVNTAAAEAAALSATQALGYRNAALGFASSAESYRNQASGYASDASDFATASSGYADTSYSHSLTSYRWANEDKDTPVSGGEFSSFHWSEKAKEYAQSVEFPVSYGSAQSLSDGEKAQARANIGLELMLLGEVV